MRQLNARACRALHLHLYAPCDDLTETASLLLVYEEFCAQAGVPAYRLGILCTQCNRRMPGKSNRQPCAVVKLRRAPCTKLSARVIALTDEDIRIAQRTILRGVKLFVGADAAARAILIFQLQLQQKTEPSSVLAVFPCSADAPCIPTIREGDTKCVSTRGEVCC